MTSRMKGSLAGLSLALVTLAIAASYDRWFCSYCSLDVDKDMASMGMDMTEEFIRSTVNRAVMQWRPGDTVTITNGERWATFRYSFSLSMLWVPIARGEGDGPGTLRNPEDMRAPGAGFSPDLRLFFPDGHPLLRRGINPFMFRDALPIGRVDVGPIQLVNGPAGSCRIACHN